ncbi:TetR/AcrR family transcriptional regulator [Desemzia sp. RIT804]|uniref:TetR/AcrR family transcriptional regulator n=1 Tax=Desemzia sp. RIT 804 TaxID=2810209 RepID=UPI00194FCD26|nr:TetR/AcrR family transcriptional regulator [Desemzia sp. RIT 804]MBM6614900.1 TetR/AcrR family transcriptional regulator [Desemzia sp. RIT 804]
MKYDLSKKPTRGAQRTLESFSKTMFNLLAKKSFENISVNEICEISNFPRATFYNYFDDKYDLLNYCWHLLSSQIYLNEQPNETSEKSLATLFDRTYYLLSSHNELLSAILKNNPLDSSLISNFSAYLKRVIQEVFHEYLHFDNNEVPIELVVDHFSNTVMLILEAIFLKRQPITLEEAHKYLNFLLGHLVEGSQ